MPNLSSCSSAYSRHSLRTSQVRHTRLASLVDPPFSGKNASGSVCAHKRAFLAPQFLGVPVEHVELSHGIPPFDP